MHSVKRTQEIGSDQQRVLIKPLIREVHWRKRLQFAGEHKDWSSSTVMGASGYGERQMK